MLGLVFTYAITALGVLAGPIRPFYGFLAYVCFSIIKPEALWYWSVPASNFSWWIALSFLSGWLIDGFGTWPRQKYQLRAIFSLVAYAIWILLSTTVSPDTSDGIRYFENAIKIIIPAIAGITLVKTDKDLYLFAWTITVSIGYLAYSLNESYFAGYNRLQEEGFAGFDNNSITIALVSGIGLNFFLGLYVKGSAQKLLLFFFSLLLVNAVLFSFSRGGMLGLIFCGLATIYLIPKTRVNLSLVAAGAVMAFSITGQEVINRFVTISNTTLTSNSASDIESSAESRLHLWRVCIEMSKDYPLFGVGPDQFIRRVGEYPIVDANGQVITYGATGANIDRKTSFGAKEAHMLWLQVAAELGIIGAVSLFAYYGFTCISSMIAIRDPAVVSNELHRHIHLMVLTSIGPFVLSASFVSLEGLELPYYVAALGLSTNKISSKSQSLLQR